MSGGRHVERCDVVVCGGGLSGLYAATLLYKQDVNVLVLEASEHAGGKALTAKNNRCYYGDLGWSYVGPTQNNILRVAKELGVHSYKVHNTGNRVLYKQEQRYLFEGIYPKIRNPLTALDFNNVTRQLDQMAKKVPKDAPWTSKMASTWDKVTAKQFLETIIWTELTKEYVHWLIRSVTSHEPHEVSLLWLLWVISSAGGIKRLTRINNGAYERKFEGGVQQLCNTLSRRLQGRVRTGSAVGKIEWTKLGAHITTHDGGMFYANHVILSMPVPMQAKIIYEPALPRSRNQLMKRMESPATIRVLLYYTRTFWRKQGLSGVSYIMDPLSPIHYTIDDTKPAENYPCIASYICGDKAREMAQYTPAMRQEKIAYYLSKVFQTEEALHPVHYEEKVWVDDQLSGSCFLAGTKNGVLSSFGGSLRQQIGSLHMGSSDTAGSWPGTMDGAVSAAERAANEVLLDMNKISREDVQQQERAKQVLVYPGFNSSLYERFAPSITGLIHGITFTTAGYVTWKLLKHTGVLENGNTQ